MGTECAQLPSKNFRPGICCLKPVSMSGLEVNSFSFHWSSTFHYSFIFLCLEPCYLLLVWSFIVTSDFFWGCCKSSNPLSPYFKSNIYSARIGRYDELSRCRSTLRTLLDWSNWSQSVLKGRGPLFYCHSSMFTHVWFETSIRVINVWEGLTYTAGFKSRVEVTMLVPVQYVCACVCVRTH